MMDELPAGRELDELVAEKVMGWVHNPPNNRGLGWLRPDGRFVGHVLEFSTDIAAAWLVVDYFYEQDDQSLFLKFINEIVSTGLGPARLMCPRICRAALKAKE